jgi:hypothetical protein
LGFAPPRAGAGPGDAPLSPRTGTTPKRLVLSLDGRASGERVWNSEVSSIDTALLMGGVLTARQRFADDPKIVRLATGLYERIDFPWMLERPSDAARDGLETRARL